MNRRQGTSRKLFAAIFLPILVAALICGIVGAQPAYAAGDPPLVRLSYVGGSVQILQGTTVQFQQAQINMPLLEGSRVETGSDGQAEIEFKDGSVARLTPNSSLQLNRLAHTESDSERTAIELLSGLAYFELNASEGQHFAVRFGSATALPTEDSILRINLDNAPELAVLQGTAHVSGSGAFDVDVAQNQSVRLNADDPSLYTLADGVSNESWDRWNADRDELIAQQAQNQTQARDLDGDGNNPGWNDLDYYGDWYPVEGYGNVWVPSNVQAGWDPYGYGSWANYPGWGYTWISGYPWGWLPYHCGAWNYFDSVGWGWIPGQCGLGFVPVAPVWNVPRGYRPPPQPIPGGHIGNPHNGSVEDRLIRVDRGPIARGPWQYIGHGVHPEHTRVIHLDGQTIAPLPIARVPWFGANTGHAISHPGHVGVPTGINNGFTGGGDLGRVRSGVVAGRPGSPVYVRPPVGTSPRPIISPSPAPIRPMPAPRMATPRMAAPAPMPRPAAPPPAPRMAAPSPAPSVGHH